MLRKLLLLSFILLAVNAVMQAQPITVSGITATNRFTTCGGSPPVVTATRVSGPGSHVSGGVLICDNACDSTIVDFTISNLHWSQFPNVEWIHGVFFTTGTGITLTGNSLGAGWIPLSSCTGATCSGQVAGQLGYYYDGTTSNSCCGATPLGDGNPSNNWGVGSIDCPTAFSISYQLRICNSNLGATNNFKVRATPDGGTGCWSQPDLALNTVSFSISATPCGSLYSPFPAATPITKTCTPTTDYTSTLTAGCGNGATVTWWTQAVGGTQVGSGSPFVYHSATCPAGTTFYAACCATTDGTCNIRKAVTITGPCPPAMTISGTITQPDCTTPTGTITMDPPVNNNGTVTYTITPGGTSNTSGVFGGLAPGGYTVTGVDAAGCTASASFTINAATTGGPGPVVTSPVTYCVGDVASPLSAPGSNLLWYTVATGGVGSSTAPTPSTAAAGTTTYYVSQNPTGSCESLRSSIVVNVNAASTITLTSAAGTNTQSVCINTAITNITYATGAGATGANVTGLPAGVTGVYSGGTNGTVTISGTPTATGTFNYTVSTTGGCGTATATGSITVNALSTLTLTSGAPSTSQTLCINTALPTNITYSTANGVTGATVTGLPAGVTGTYSGGTNGTVTISGTPTASGTFSYTVTTSGGCGTVSLTGTITVNPNVTITLTSGAASTSQTVCINTAITNITYSTANGVTGATVTGLPAGVTGTYSGGTNGTVTISGTPTASGTFNYTVTTSGGCSTASLTGSITVNPNATLTLTSAASTANQTVNINTPITTITYNAGNGATGATVTGLPAGVTATVSGGVVTITGSPSVTGTFNYSVTTTGGCSSVTLNGTIIVNDLSGITLTSAAGTDAQSICINTALTNIVYTTSGGATGASITAGALPAGVTGVYSGGTNGTFTISGTPTVAGTFNYTVTTSGGVGTASASGSITVNPNVTLTLTSAAASTAQTVCINTGIAGISYSTANGVTGATVTGLPAGVTGVYSGGTNGTISISGSPSATGTFNYTVTTSGGCSTASLTGSITVNPNVTLTLGSAAGTDAQTLCINTALTNITYNAGSGATGASVTAGALPAGVTGSFAGGVFTISGTPTASGTFNYTVTTSGGCSTASQSGTITVNPNVTMTLTSAAGTNAQTLCINTALTNIDYTTASGATGASITAGALPAGVTGTYSGGTNGTFTISGTPTVAGTFNYTVTTSGGCSSVSLSGTITVNPATTITLTSPAATAAQTVCINTAATNIVYSTANGATGVTVTGLPAGVSGTYSGGTNGTFTISGTPSVNGTFNYTVSTTGGCGTATLTGSITVNSNVTMTLTSPAGSDAQSICINTALGSLSYSTANGATGVSITAGALPAGVTGTYSGGTNGTFTISGTPTVAGTFNYTVTTSGGCSSVSLSGSVTVNPNATISLTSGGATTAQSVCINSPITNITYSTANGATGATVTGLPAGVTGTYAGGVFTISGSPSVSGTFNYTVTTSGGCGTASLSGSITSNANTTLTLTSAAGTDGQLLCINTAITNITYAAGNGATGASITAGALPAGVTGSFAGGVFTISGTPTVSGIFNYTVTTSGGCSAASQSGTITVSPNVTMTLTSAAGTDAQTICTNTALTNIDYTTGNGATGASITAGSLPAGVSGTYSGGVFTISGTPTANGTFNYTVTTSGGCSSVSLSGTITVNPAATLTLSSAAGTDAQTVCVNTAITNITYAAASGATGASVTAGALPAGVTGSFAGGTFTITGTPTATGTFNYTVTSSGGCGTASQSGTITVNPNVTMTLTSAAGTDAQTVCINTAIANIDYTTANGATGASVTAGALPAGVNGSFAGGVFTISGTPTVSGTFNYTVTTSGGCSSVSLSGTITVNPAATISLTSSSASTSQAICENTAITNIVYTTGNGATGATVTGLPAGVTGTYAGGVFTISGTATASGTYNYTVSTTGGCGTATMSGTIDVVAIPPAPGVVSPVRYCPGDASAPLTATGTNLLWYTSATGGSGSAVAPTPSTAVSGSTFSYWVSQSTTTASCESPRSQIDVIVNNPLSINIGSDVTICQGDTAFFNPVVTPAATSYQWRQYTGLYPGTPNSIVPSTISSINGAMFPVDTAEYILRATYGGCAAEDTVRVNVRWKPIIEAGANTAICLDRSNGVNSVVLTASVSHISQAVGTPNNYGWSPVDSLGTPLSISTTAYPTHTTWYTFTDTLTVANYGCDFIVHDSVKVVVQPIVHAFAGNDTIGQLNSQHRLHGTGGISYLWSSANPSFVITHPNSQNADVLLTGDGNFFLEARDAIGCVGYDSVFVMALSGPTYWVPNAFSPNGDGLNDIFRAIPPGIATTTYFRVFNRYGELLFETNQWLKGWDGTYKGKPQPNGVYVWSVKGVDRNNKPVEMQGTVTLVR